MDKDYLQKRAAELGLGRQDILADIQRWLDERYPSRCRALSLNNGVLRVTTLDSAVASDLRLHQVEVLRVFGPRGVERVAISVT